MWCFGFSEARKVSDDRGGHDPVSPILNNQGSENTTMEGDVWVNKPEWDIPPSVPEECGICEPRVKRGPGEPTEDEIVKHYVTHLPYRSWCPHCVAAAGKATPHVRSSGERDEAVPSHHVDYWFMRDAPGSESTPVVVLRDNDTKAIGAHAVTVKGYVEWVADKICEDIDRFGNAGKILIKSDQ